MAIGGSGTLIVAENAPLAARLSSAMFQEQAHRTCAVRAPQMFFIRTPISSASVLNALNDVFELGVHGWSDLEAIRLPEATYLQRASVHLPLFAISLHTFLLVFNNNEQTQ
jgi:hypothetical protein